MNMKSIPFCSVITWHWAFIDTCKRPYLTCSVRVQDLVFDDKPQPLPLLLIALWPLQIPTHGGVVCVCWHLKQVKPICERSGLYHRITVPLDHEKASVTSLRAAGIFFCFLGKAKVALFPGDTAADRACSPDEQKCGTCNCSIQRKYREYKVCLCLFHNWCVSIRQHINMKMTVCLDQNENNGRRKPDLLFCCCKIR